MIQFGPVALSQEASCLTIGCCRSSCISLVKGGLGQLVKEILKKTFQDTNFDVTKLKPKKSHGLATATHNVDVKLLHIMYT